MLGPKYPWVKALYDKDLPRIWLPQIPLWSSSSNTSITSGWTHCKYGPEYDCLYSFYYFESQYWSAFLWTFSALILFLGNVPSFRKDTTGSIQLGLTCIIFTLTGNWPYQLDATRSSTLITLSGPSSNEVAKVTNELAWGFLLLRTCFIENTSKLDYSCFTWLRYHCILWSLAPNPFLTCLVMSLESQNTSTTLPQCFYTVFKPTRRASYSALLFMAGKLNLKDFSMAGKLNLKDFSMVMHLGETRIILILEPFRLAAPSTYNSQSCGRDIEINKIYLSSIPPSTMTSFSIPSVNSATSSAKTCPFTTIRGKYLMLNSFIMDPHFATLPV